jgi:hypothetical protein
VGQVKPLLSGQMNYVSLSSENGNDQAPAWRQRSKASLPQGRRSTAKRYASRRRSVPNRQEEDRMAFTFKLQHEDGTPADPHTLHTAIPNWRPGDTIPLGRDRALRVVEIRPGPDGEPVLVVVPG